MSRLLRSASLRALSKPATPKCTVSLRLELYASSGHHATLATSAASAASATSKRSLHYSNAHLKKKSPLEKDEKQAAARKAPVMDPKDFSELENDLAKVTEKLQAELSKLRPGGKFNPEVIENLKAKVKDPATKKEDMYKIGDLAQVFQKGRVVHIMVSDEALVKAVSTAVMASNLSLTPQPDANNKLQLNVPLPPPTAESRRQVIEAAGKAAQTAEREVDKARQDCKKRLHKMRDDKVATADTLKKAEQQMETLVKAIKQKVKSMVDSTKKVLEGAS